VAKDSDLFAKAHGRRRRNEVKRSFFRRDLVWRKTTCWPGFDQEVLKVLRKTTYWAWFDHEVLIVVGEEVWN